MTKYIFFAIICCFVHAISLSQVTSLAQNESLYFLGLLNSNKAVFYSDANKSLWVSDGTPAGTKEITKKVTLTSQITARVLNGKLLFTAVDATHGNELWITDGTDAGTMLVKDINPGASGSDISDRMVLLNNKIYFSAFTLLHGREVWVSDGTATGTSMLKDIAPGAASSNSEMLYKIVRAGNLLYMVCNLPETGQELWRTDGTNAGTFLVKDILPGIGSSIPNIQGTLGDKALFVAGDNINGREPWISDGTSEGTFLLKNIFPGNLPSSPDHFIELNGKAIFAAYDDVHGQELWETDGTTIGTKLLKDIEPGSIGSAPELINSVQINGKLIYKAWTEQYGYELWETNGTADGTKLFKNIGPGMEDSYPILLPAYGNGYRDNSGLLFRGNKFFFTATTLANGAELYVSDGTPQGTNMVKDLYPGPEFGFNSVFSYYISNSAIYFSGTDGSGASALYASDGTEAGTRKIGTVRNDGMYAAENPFIIVNSFLLFTADDGNSNPNYFDLYRINTNDVVLPVVLRTFKGQKINGVNQLDWQVESAKHFKHFEVEKSKDGKSFTGIGSVNYSRGRSNYRFTDANVEGSNELFYRLKLVDLDGSYQYSTVVQLKNIHVPTAFSAYQSSPGKINVQYHVQSPSGKLLIVNSNGQVLQSIMLNGQQGTALISVNMATTGILYLQLIAGKEKYTQSILMAPF
jgi:ELWxxDGT repeat protein